MSQQNKETASFKTEDLAALFGCSVKERGNVIVHGRGIVTVQFKHVTAKRVPASLFNVHVKVVSENEEGEAE